MEYLLIESFEIVESVSIHNTLHSSNIQIDSTDQRRVAIGGFLKGGKGKT